MAKTYTYVAEAGIGNDGEEFYVCHACNKEQMRYAGMNMKLNWIRFNSREEASELLQGNIIKRESNVSSVQYWK